MITSLRLVDYEDLLDPRDIYSLIALTTYYNGFFGQCSKAFIKLETLAAEESSSMAALPEQGKKLREAYADVAMSIFSSDSPNDPGSRSYPCTHCRSPIKGWYVLITKENSRDPAITYSCSICVFSQGNELHEMWSQVCWMCGQWTPYF